MVRKFFEFSEDKLNYNEIKVILLSSISFYYGARSFRFHYLPRCLFFSYLGIWAEFGLSKTNSFLRIEACLYKFTAL